MRSQLELIRKEKNDFYLKHKCSEYESKKKLVVTIDKTSGDSKHAWSSRTCLIVGDSILTGVDEKRLSKDNQLVKVQGFRGTVIDDLKHHLVPLLDKKPEHIILHTGTNGAVSKTSEQILDELLQLKQYVTNVLPICIVIVSRSTMWTDNGKADLTLSKFNEHLGQLEADFIDNVSIKKVHQGKKSLHLNKKGKLELNFL